MKWIVTGADSSTGKTRKVEVEAESEKQAVSCARGLGVYTYRIQRLPDTLAPPPQFTPPPPEADDVEVRCPACKSKQITADKRGYSSGAGAVGCLLLGPLGLIFGAPGSNQVKLTCLKCGFQFDPGGG